MGEAEPSSGISIPRGGDRLNPVPVVGNVVPVSFPGDGEVARLGPAGVVGQGRHGGSISDVGF